MNSNTHSELERVDLDDWHHLRLGQRAQIVAKITGRAGATLILENSNWTQQIAENPYQLGISVDPRSYMMITIMRTTDGMTALAAVPIESAIQ
ncbi:MAG: hypothetical protein CL949_20540 [Erythrobacter sp.]|nr:hypothetical protein [Erythrobacter sp.]|tara:strand:+ start:48 stop:326 length:279 start_codon:yes stop_codon:yes gene_type:complete